MTKDEFAKNIEDITGAYQSVCFNDHSLDVWYKYLGEFDYDVLNKVVTEYIRENPRPPTISDFYGRCKKISGFRSQVSR